jgi:hypothetical protein
MGQTSVPAFSIWPHIAVTEAKGEQIKANLSEPPLGNSNNPKEAEAVEALLESEIRDCRKERHHKSDYKSLH